MLGSDDELGQGIPDAGESEESVPVAESLGWADGPDIDGSLSAADGVAAIRESVGIPANAGSGGSQVPLPVDDSVSAGLVTGGPVDDEPVVDDESAVAPESAERVVAIEPVTAPAVELVRAGAMLHDDAEQRTRQGWPNAYGYDPELWP